MELALAHRVGRDLTVLLGLVLMDCLGQNACQYVSATLITQTCESCHVIFVLHRRLSAHCHTACLTFCLTFRTEEALYHSRSAPFGFSSSMLRPVSTRQCGNANTLTHWNTQPSLRWCYNMHSWYVTISWTCPWRVLLSKLWHVVTRWHDISSFRFKKSKGISL